MVALLGRPSRRGRARDGLLPDGLSRHWFGLHAGEDKKQRGLSIHPTSSRQTRDRYRRPACASLLLDLPQIKPRRPLIGRNYRCERVEPEVVPSGIVRLPFALQTQDVRASGELVYAPVVGLPFDLFAVKVRDCQLLAVEGHTVDAVVRRVDELAPEVRRDVLVRSEER